jgi:hypothetical protein
MTGRKKASGPISATELMARLQNDPEYQRKMQEAEAERDVRVQALRRAEQPIVADLRSAGLEVNSVWDLVNTSDSYPAALPILLKHLQLGSYPDRVMDSLGRALAVGPAAFAWDTLRELYLKARGRGEEEGLAVALAAAATAEHLDPLIELLGEDSRSDTRIHFLSAIKRVGGKRGRQVLETLRSDPMFGKETRALLKSRK